jgi:hypothetical protein
VDKSTSASQPESWWKLRRRFLREAFVKGLQPYVWAFGLLSLAVGITFVTVIGFVWHQPRLGIALAALLVVAILLEGAFRLRREEAGRADDAEHQLVERSRPRLSATVPPPHFNTFVPVESGSGKYATIDVESTEAVVGCRGHIAEITTEGVEIPVRAPIPLRWIAHDQLTRDLVPGITYGMTVVFTESPRPTEFMLSTDSHLPRGIPWALNPGVSLLKVVVSAEGVPPLDVHLRVDARNTWQLLDMNLVESATWEELQASEWAAKHPNSALLGLRAGGTGPFDDVREKELARQIAAATTATTGGTINFESNSQEKPQGG